MRALLALLFRQVVGHLWRSREPPRALVMTGDVWLLYPDGHVEYYRPEQARQMGYHAEADEAEVAWAKSLVKEHGYSSDVAWKLVTENRERFKDGTWKQQRRWRREAEEEWRKMSEERRQELAEDFLERMTPEEREKFWED